MAAATLITWSAGRDTRCTTPRPGTPTCAGTARRSPRTVPRRAPHPLGTMAVYRNGRLGTVARVRSCGRENATPVSPATAMSLGDCPTRGRRRTPHPQEKAQRRRRLSDLLVGPNGAARDGRVGSPPPAPAETATKKIGRAAIFSPCHGSRAVLPKTSSTAGRSRRGSSEGRRHDRPTGVVPGP